MSALFGIYNCTGAPVEQTRLFSMSEALAHRGPDGKGLWVDNAVGFGHRLLTTTPEAATETLPYFCPETGIAITTDCRLDNRKELIATLGRENFKGDIVPDSLLLIHAYLHWQDACVEHLLGDFSFVIWDKKKQKIFCARDHLGVKPFYYYFEAGEFIFCSESHPIAGDSCSNTPLNELRIGDHLVQYMEGYDRTSTFYSTITRLPPAHTLVIENNRLTTACYWTPTTEKTPVLSTDREYQDAFTELLSRCVTDRCRGLDNPGILLSGGVDSATIMTLARDACEANSNRTVHTYSGINGNLEHCRESQLIQKLTNTQSISSQLYTPTDLIAESDSACSLLSQLQEPFDTFMVMAFILYRKAAQAGNKVMLDGADGDLATSLTPHYPALLFRKGALRSAIRETMMQSSGYYGGTISKRTLLYDYLRSAMVPQWIKDWRFRRTVEGNIEKTIKQCALDNSFIERTGYKSRLTAFEYNNRPQKRSFPEGYYCNAIVHPFMAAGLERYDRIGSICSVEPRHPLLDKRIVDFFAGLPWNQMVRNGWTKYLLRKTAERYLPDDICWRSGKEHLGWTFSKTLQKEKNDFFYRIISNHYEFLRIFTNYNIEIKQQNAYTGDVGKENKSLMLNIAGLAMWLENRKRAANVYAVKQQHTLSQTNEESIQTAGPG